MNTIVPKALLIGEIRQVLPHAKMVGLPLSPDAVLTGLSVNSREVASGNVFAALPGVNFHGAKFAKSALDAGAALILTDIEGAKQIRNEIGDAPVLAAQDARLALSHLARAFYPLQPKTMVAVTGTNGKTSVASFTRQIWQEMGLSAVNFGTAGVEGALEAPLSHTTPEPVTLHALLTELAYDGVTHASMEASSHGLDQHRLDGVTLKAAGFTNITRDHMDYHGSFGDYFAAKAGLFERVLPHGATAVINYDDPFGETLRLIAEGRAQKVIGTGKNEAAALRLLDQRFTETGQTIRFSWQGKTYQKELQLIGDFQSENLLVAAGMVLTDETVNAEDVFDTFPKLTSVRGRMERAAVKANGAAIFVDYAHTPDALETALRALRPHTMARLIVVVGAGGDRDTGKRPLMGKAAVEGADIAIITDDNPRTENPASIREAVMLGAAGATEIGDRAEAILRAVDMAEAGDIVLIAGKGHERGQIIGTQVMPFDDVEQASLSVAVLEGRE